MELQGFGFKIRSWQTGDEVSLLQNANNPKVSQYLENRFPTPYTAADAQVWINAHLNQPKPIINAALIIADEVAGAFGITLQNDIYVKNARIGYWLAEQFLGKGIMTAALTLFTDYVFAEFDVERIVTGVFGSNPASAKVLQKVGFQHEGTFKKALFKKGFFDDELIFAKLRS